MLAKCDAQQGGAHVGPTASVPFVAVVQFPGLCLRAKARLPALLAYLLATHEPSALGRPMARAARKRRFGAEACQQVV